MPRIGSTQPSDERFEAREWLRTNPNPSAFASNRFDETRNAARFVERLYTLGAIAVYITNVHNEPRRIRTEGGPYADSLIVVLPGDPDSRIALFDVINQEAEEEGFDQERDKGQDEVFMWWD